MKNFLTITLLLLLPLVSIKGQQKKTLESLSTKELLKLKEYCRREMVRLEKEKRRTLIKGIQDGEDFLRSHSDSKMLDKVLIRLGELYYRLAEDKFIHDMQRYEREFEKYEKGLLSKPPEEPKRDFSKAIEKYQMLIDRFPESELVDDALYNMAFALEQSGRTSEAKDVYKRLIDQFPKSKYVPEALMRIAEYYFNPPISQIRRAIKYYKKVLEYKDTPRYSEALYKLGWSYYRLGQYPDAISYFTLLVEEIDREKRQGLTQDYANLDLMEESIEYIGISFHDFGGLKKAIDYIKALGTPTYGADILHKIGDIYKDVREEYQMAAETYDMLLKLYPYTPQAPEIKDKIVECALRLEDYQWAYKEREELFRTYRPGSEWSRKVKDEEAINRAHRLAERALRENINFCLAQAEKTNDINLFQSAVRDCRKYLRYFPSDTSALLIHWNLAVTLDTKLKRHAEAYEEYMKISNLYDDPKYKKDAARNAIATAEDALERAPLLAETIKSKLKAKEGEKRLKDLRAVREREFSEAEKRVVKAYNNFIRLFPHDPETAVVLAHAGALYYNHNKFSEALKYFHTLITRFPNSPELNRARYAVMESYFGKMDFKSVEILARRIMKSDAPEEIKAKAKRRLAEAIFLHAQTLAEKGEAIKAAREFSRVAAETPYAPFADVALFNSAFQYDKAKLYAEAVKIYRHLVNSYPDSKLLLDALNNLAIDYAELGSYGKAAATYEQLAQRQSDPKKAQDALYNASVYYVKAQDWEGAIRVNRLFAERFPNSKDAEALYYDIPNYYLKLGDPEGCYRAYGEFVTKYPDSPRTVEALFRRGEYLLSRGMKDRAIAEMNRAISKNEELKKKGKEGDDFFAAEALFSLTEIQYKEYDSIEFKLRDISANKKRKKDLLLKLVDQYTRVAAYKTPRLYEATYKIGRVYEEFAQTWAEQEIPIMEETKRAVYQTKINQTTARLYEKALKAYKNSLKVLTEVAETYKRVSPHDSTVAAAEKWILRCGEKVSEVLYRMAEINFKSIGELLSAPLPPDLDDLAILEYRNQVLTKAVKPLIINIINAHKRNLKEAQELNLDNEWVEKSRDKIIAVGNILPQEYCKLSFDALKTYRKRERTYLDLVSHGSPEDQLRALDVASDMVNLIEAGRVYSLTAIRHFQNILKEARKVGIADEALKDVEERIMQFVYQMGSSYLALADSSARERDRFSFLFRKEDRPEYEDAVFTFQENHDGFKKGAVDVLQSGYQVGEELGVNNPWVGRIIAELVRADPQKYAPRFGIETAIFPIPSDSTWSVATDSLEGWTEIDFDDSSWKKAQVVAPMRTGIPALDTIRALSIWYQNTPELFLRKTFQIQDIPVNGEVILVVDDGYNLYLNGENIANVANDTLNWKVPRRYKVSNFLKRGKNVVAVRATEKDLTGFGLRALLRVEVIQEKRLGFIIK